MNEHLEAIILEKTNASKIIDYTIMQSLWSGYGEIIRCQLLESSLNSIVVKHINLPEQRKHPRGWNSNHSHQRKLKSYQVEMAFYKYYSQLCSHECYVPKHIYSESNNDESIIILEDLNNSGFPEVKRVVNLSEIKRCLKWLANFHATFMGYEAKGLWKTGTYWHLETRPDELDALQDLPLKNAAASIDKVLNQTKFQTLVHGDAKLANFCFNMEGTNVSAVDFQYVGGGCGIKDVAYFIGSCLEESDCETLENELLYSYFKDLENALITKGRQFNFEAIKKEWYGMYPYAWADFHRFLKGWSPGHWKINSYSEKLSQHVINTLQNT
ncbi:oxidoreductase family protein [Cognatitamlana onchidii]|uniref:oxidoreductase family protein n=1 Tax=Cognatitamlana onchidii TaxID=2562860 RepID=UPI0010A668D3|nr:oxidoreductase family protein [Algibacter onchidii]